MEEATFKLKRCCGFEYQNSNNKKKKKSLLCLPDELIVEILEWLPVKSIARFRCVANTWLSLFKDPIFIENHRRKQGKNGTMLLVRRCLLPTQLNGTENVLSFHDLDSPESEVRPSVSITFLKDLLQIQKYTPAFDLVGSCNGIVCIKYARRHVLCNPALHQFKPLPPCSSYCPHGCKGRWLAQGFGVAFGNDFKVIVMHTVFEENNRGFKPNFVMVHVYSSRTNSWRQINDSPVHPIVRTLYDYVFLNGACHWAARTFAHDRKMILSWDINSEVYKQLELPDCLCQLDIAYPIPIVLKGCTLGLVQYRKWFDDFVHPVEVWGMNEYGVKESWTKMFVISPQPLAMTFLHWKDDILFMIHERRYRLPLERRIQYRDEDRLDERLNDQLTSICLKTKEMNKSQIFGAQNTMRDIIYEESLVTLN